MGNTKERKSLLSTYVLALMATIGTWVQVLLEAVAIIISLHIKQEDSNRPTKD